MPLTRNGYLELRRDLAIDARRTVAVITEALDAGELKPTDFSLRALAEHAVPDGAEWVRSLAPGNESLLLESGGAVDTTQFANITGQIVYNRVMEASQQDDFVFSRLIPTIPTQFSGERIAGISGIGDESESVAEGALYPLAGVNEDYIDTPQTTKRGVIVPVTKEAIFFDRTGLVLRRAAQVGEWLGYNKEVRLVNAVIDENVTAHRYKWRGTTIATYDNNSGTHSWDNLQSSTSLVDHTDIDACEQLLAAMTDPNTGTPMAMMADTLICSPSLRATAHIALNATMVALQAGGFATSGNLYQTSGASPLGKTPYSGSYQIVSSRILHAQLGTKTTWFLGKPTAAFAYMENWGIQVSQAPSNSEAEFTQDIVLRFKASERGAVATIEPRYMVKATA